MPWVVVSGYSRFQCIEIISYVQDVNVVSIKNVKSSVRVFSLYKQLVEFFIILV